MYQSSNHLHVLFTKLKRLKQCLKEFNRTFFGGISQRVGILNYADGRLLSTQKQISNEIVSYIIKRFLVKIKDNAVISYPGIVLKDLLQNSLSNEDG